MVSFESLGNVSYSHSVVTMDLSCIVIEIKRDIGRKSWFFQTPAFDIPVRDGPRRNIAMTFGTEKQEWRGEPTVKKMWSVGIGDFRRFISISHTVTGWFFTTFGEMTHADKTVNLIHFRLDPADIRIRVQINLEIRIRIADQSLT